MGIVETWEIETLLIKILFFSKTLCHSWKKPIGERKSQDFNCHMMFYSFSTFKTCIVFIHTRIFNFWFNGNLFWWQSIYVKNSLFTFQTYWHLVKVLEIENWAIGSIWNWGKLSDLLWHSFFMRCQFDLSDFVKMYRFIVVMAL